MVCLFYVNLINVINFVMEKFKTFNLFQLQLYSIIKLCSVLTKKLKFQFTCHNDVLKWWSDVSNYRGNDNVKKKYSS